MVSNVYAFDLDIDRVARLVEAYPGVWQQFEREIQVFVDWLKELADRLDADD